MAVNAATQAQVEAVRDEAVKLEKIFQKLVQTYPGDGEIDTAFATELDAAITAAKTAIDAVNAAA